MFFTYKRLNGENLYMENSSTSKVLDVGRVILKMTFGKLLTLNKVSHVANIIKNLVFGPLLSKNSF